MNDIVSNQQEWCFFCPLGQPAVVWLEDGRGACGQHERDLTRLGAQIRVRVA